MRGKADKFLIPSTYVRITPAYAGKSIFPHYHLTDSQDHPRLCGEKDLDRWEDKLDRGITPAYAGKRGQLSDSISGQWDHPRLCGEKQKRFTQKTARSGSPPPMRGKGGVKVLSATERRITPAYAGKRDGCGF